MPKELPYSLTFRPLIGTFGPVSQAIFGGLMRSPEGSPDIRVKNRDFDIGYNDTAASLAQVAYRQYVRRHGYPKPGTTINMPLNANVYKEVNPNRKYADFTDPLGWLNAAAGGYKAVEFTDGGMSAKGKVNADGTVDVTMTDRTAYELGNKEKRMFNKKGGLNKVRTLMTERGSRANDNRGDFVQELKYTIPRDTTSFQFGHGLGPINDIATGTKLQLLMPIERGVNRLINFFTPTSNANTKTPGGKKSNSKK